MSKLISFAALFSAVGVAAAFDDAVINDARNGRVFAPFAELVSAEYGIPLLAEGKANQWRPIGKTAFLAIAQGYRDDVRAGNPGPVKAWGKRVALGRALDLIAVTMHPAADVIGDEAAWEALKPAKKASTKGTPAAVAGGVVDTNSAAQGDDEGQEQPQAATLGVALADAYPVVLAALKAGALSAVQRACLVAALAETAPTYVEQARDAIDGLAVLSAQGDALTMADIDAMGVRIGAVDTADVGASLPVLDLTGLPEVAPVVVTPLPVILADDMAGNVFAMVDAGPLLLAAPVPKQVSDAAPLFHAGADDDEAAPAHVGAMAQALAAAGVALPA